jgi:hypothetical protein
MGNADRIEAGRVGVGIRPRFPIELDLGSAVGDCVDPAVGGVAAGVAVGDLIAVSVGDLAEKPSVVIGKRDGGRVSWIDRLRLNGWAVLVGRSIPRVACVPPAAQLGLTISGVQETSSSPASMKMSLASK